MIVRWIGTVGSVEEPTMTNPETKTEYPIIKPGQVIPASGGLVEYKDGTGTPRLLRVLVIPHRKKDVK